MTIELAPYVGALIYGMAVMSGAIGCFGGALALDTHGFSRATWYLAVAVWLYLLAEGLAR